MNLLTVDSLPEPLRSAVVTYDLAVDQQPFSLHYATRLTCLKT
ncbi:MAG: hypothetical protein AAFW84_19830 [Cyanobacteria bacterium J06635_15]